MSSSLNDFHDLRKTQDAPCLILRSNPRAVPSVIAEYVPPSPFELRHRLRVYKYSMLGALKSIYILHLGQLEPEGKRTSHTSPSVSGYRPQFRKWKSGIGKMAVRKH